MVCSATAEFGILGPSLSKVAQKGRLREIGVAARGKYRFGIGHTKEPGSNVQ